MKHLDFIKFGKFVAVAILIAVFLFYSNNSLADDVHFISDVNAWDKSTNKPTPVEFYYLNQHQMALIKKLTVNSDEPFGMIALYPAERLIMITSRGTAKPKFRIYDMDNIDQCKILVSDNDQLISEFHVFFDKAMGGYVELILDKDTANLPTKAKMLDIRSGNELAVKSYDTREIKLAGLGTSYTHSKPDIVLTSILADGHLQYTVNNIGIALPNVPSNIRKFECTRGWNMIANDSSFCAFQSIPDRNGLTRREILIYNKQTNKWNSLLIEGGETGMRIINGWLCGIIADPNRETDNQQRKGSPPILRENVVLINPLENHQFKVHLGKNSEVLWIEGDTVYYRIDQGLYKARIENDDFVDRQLLLTDPRVRHFHWAFTGKSPKQIENEKME